MRYSRPHHTATATSNTVAACQVLPAGFQLFVFTGRTGTFFARTIANPLAAAFLDAGYWASVAIEALAGRQRLWAEARKMAPWRP